MFHLIIRCEPLTRFYSFGTRSKHALDSVCALHNEVRVITQVYGIVVSKFSGRTSNLWPFCAWLSTTSIIGHQYGA